MKQLTEKEVNAIKNPIKGANRSAHDTVARRCGTFEFKCCKQANRIFLLDGMKIMTMKRSFVPISVHHLEEGICSGHLLLKHSSNK